MAGKQHEKHRRRGPGRPFVKGDPRINRAMPGPGRPAEEFKAWLRGRFDDPKEREQLWARAGKSDYLMGKLLAYYGQPVQPVEQVVQFDLSRLTREELETLARLLEGVAVPAAPAGPVGISPRQPGP